MFILEYFQGNVHKSYVSPDSILLLTLIDLVLIELRKRFLKDSIYQVQLQNCWLAPTDDPKDEVRYPIVVDGCTNPWVIFLYLIF